MKTKYSDDHIIQEIKRGNSGHVLSYLYETTKYKLTTWIKRNNGDDIEAQDIFQDAVLTFYEYVVQDKFEKGNSVEGLIFSIGRYQWIKRAKQKNRLVT